MSFREREREWKNKFLFSSRAGPTSPPVLHHLLSVPVAVIDDYPQSPAERYVAIRSSMLYDVNAQQADTPRSPVVSRVPSTASQQIRIQSKLHPPTVVIQPPSTSSTASRSKRPEYQRQETEVSDPLIINGLAGTPVFHAIPESVQSTADYPMGTSSSIANSSILRIQMSHAQHMQAWQQNQLRKLQKKRPHCYHYGAPLRRPLEEKVATAAILTPQPLPDDGKSARTRSKSPFRFPRQEETINEKSEKNRSKSDHPTRTTTSSSSNTTEKKQDQSLQKKSTRVTSSSGHRKDSQNSLSNVTEV